MHGDNLSSTYSYGGVDGFIVRCWIIQRWALDAAVTAHKNRVNMQASSSIKVFILFIKLCLQYMGKKQCS